VSLDAVVVVPARDEEDHIGACLEALATQRGVARDAYAVLVVLDACRDATAQRARAAAARHPGLQLALLDGPGQGVGAARRVGMDEAARRLLAAGRPRGLIASTDADTIVAPDWLARQLELVAAGAQAVAGDIRLAGAPPDPAARRAVRGARRLALVRERDPAAEHPHFAGASMALTAETYVTIGGMEPLRALEDDALGRRLEAAGVHIARSADVRVHTAARTDGRAPRGLAYDLALDDWLARRTYDAGDYPLERIAAAKQDTVSVILPAKECAATLPAILRHLLELRDAGIVDELLVVDADSRDGTARAAARLGVPVAQESALLSRFGPARGKGDAMWRGLSATDGDVVAFLDADSADVRDDFVRGLLGPLLCHGDLQLVKGAFARPFHPGEGATPIPDGGGRVTELMARPLINLHVPRLAGFVQPLAGEVAARRELLERLPFPVGYGVEIAMLMDALELVGLDALAQVRLPARHNRHQPLTALGAMSYAILVAVERRLGRTPAPAPYVRPGGDGFDERAVAVDERPPLAAIGASAEGAEDGRWPASPPTATARSSCADPSR
jgi:glycosyltransferase involved in cell wall biosynthesis